jgi:hypothetical protein
MNLPRVKIPWLFPAMIAAGVVRCVFAIFVDQNATLAFWCGAAAFWAFLACKLYERFIIAAMMVDITSRAGLEVTAKLLEAEDKIKRLESQRTN